MTTAGFSINYALPVAGRTIRRVIAWTIRAAVIAGLLVLGHAAEHWRWASAAAVAVVVVFGAELAARIALLVGQRPFDRRRGLMVREWSALRVLGNCAMSSDSKNFNQFALSTTKRTDDEVLIGYATILVNMQLASRLGQHPSDDQLQQLSAECIQRWRAVMRRQPEVLTRLLFQARDYKRDGMPDANWDTFRAMAAASGVLRRIPQMADLPQPPRSKKLRFEVATAYRKYQAAKEAATDRRGSTDHRPTRPSIAGSEPEPSAHRQGGNVNEVVDFGFWKYLQRAVDAVRQGDLQLLSKTLAPVDRKSVV